MLPTAPIENATAKMAPPGLAAAVVSTDGAAEIVISGLADARRPRCSGPGCARYRARSRDGGPARSRLGDYRTSPAVALFRTGEPPAGSLGAASGGTATRRHDVPQPPAAAAS